MIGLRGASGIHPPHRRVQSSFIPPAARTAQTIYPRIGSRKKKRAFSARRLYFVAGADLFRRTSPLHPATFRDETSIAAHILLLLAGLCLSACDTGGDLKDYETRAQVNLREAQRLAESVPPKMTWQQALVEYRKCTRQFSGRMAGNPCQRWMDLAYPPSSHMLHGTPGAPGGNNVPVTDELLDKLHPRAAIPSP